MYAWLKSYGEANPQQAAKPDLEAENARLKADLRRMTEERDILKKAAVGSTHQRNTPAYNLLWSLKFQYFTWTLI